MRQTFFRVFRLLYITRVLVKHGLDELLFSIPWLRPYRYILKLNPLYWLEKRIAGSPGERLRLALEELGPTFIKLGQMLSTRRDLLPDEITQELAKLQDAVPPFPSATARGILLQSLGRPLDEVFAYLEDEPAAAASIAQVHFGQLRNGCDVAIKIRRPGIEKIIVQDLSILFLFARFLERYSAEARRLRARIVASEYAKNIMAELDLLREAANANQLRRNFENARDLLHVPQVYWDYCSEGVLVMERIRGIPLNQLDALKAANVDFDQLSRHAAEIFFRQVFLDAYFHADMHPGNIFIEPDTGRFAVVDFGIMGTLDRDSQHYLAENMIAFFDRDYQRVAQMHVEAGWVPAGTNVQDFEAAIRAIAEPILERPFNEISVGQLLLRLFQTTRQFNMQTQPQLLLLQKTLVNVEGISREFNPGLNMWEIATPMLSSWMNRQRGPLAWLNEMREHAPHWGLHMPRLPSLVHNVLDMASQGQLVFYLRSDQLDTLQAEIRLGLHRIFVAIIAMALIVSGVIIATLGHNPSYHFLGIPLLSWGLVGAGTAMLLYIRQRGG